MGSLLTASGKMLPRRREPPGPMLGSAGWTPLPPGSGLPPPGGRWL
jgi:hypothetical protein